MAAIPTLTRARIAPGAYFAQHEIDWDKVAAFGRSIRRGDRFPPVIVVRYGERVMPLDGHHRLAAGHALGIETDAWEADGEAFEDYACEVGSRAADVALIRAGRALIAAGQQS